MTRSSGVQRVSDIIAEISSAATEQSQGIGQVNGAVAQLDQMTQQNAALVEELAPPPPPSLNGQRRPARWSTARSGTWRGCHLTVQAVDARDPKPPRRRAAPRPALAAFEKHPAQAPPSGAQRQRSARRPLFRAIPPAAPPRAGFQAEPPAPARQQPAPPMAAGRPATPGPASANWNHAPAANRHAAPAQQPASRCWRPAARMHRELRRTGARASPRNAWRSTAANSTTRPATSVKPNRNSTRADHLVQHALHLRSTPTRRRW